MTAPTPEWSALRRLVEQVAMIEASAIEYRDELRLSLTFADAKALLAAAKAAQPASPGAEVVERVARAIYEADPVLITTGPDANKPWTWDEFARGGPYYEKVLAMARAAITAHLTALQPPRRTG